MLKCGSGAVDKCGKLFDTEKTMWKTRINFIHNSVIFVAKPAETTKNIDFLYYFTKRKNVYGVILALKTYDGKMY